MANMSARKLAVLLTLSLGTYAFIVRPRLLRWGATDNEVKSPYPGADLIPDGKRSGTMAVTIKAPPAKVWPWLVQMGYRRAGWYSWDYLDNFGR
ncbi:MAG: alpha/beta fold hydrolase, partial [Vulcanimicrobiaceae bacterium]